MKIIVVEAKGDVLVERTTEVETRDFQCTNTVVGTPDFMGPWWGGGRGCTG